VSDSGSSIRRASSSFGLSRLLELPMPAEDELAGGSLMEATVDNQASMSRLHDPPQSKPDVKLLVNKNDERCGYNISKIDHDAVDAVLSHTALSSLVVPNGPTQELRALQGQKIYIAACLHQAEEVLPHWTKELVRLLLSVRQVEQPGAASNVFVSIYESGSTDKTKALLSELRGHLDFIGVPHSIVLGNQFRNGTNRIEFLAKVRNEALKPLAKSDVTYDQVFWLNDIWYCADAALQVLYHALPEASGGLGADAVCGMDYKRDNRMKCQFYDKWVCHDMQGGNMPNSEWNVKHNGPFQVFSCWNGLVSFAGDLFQKHGLRFRRSNPKLQECAASESELIFHDIYKLGRGKVAVSPAAAVSYADSDFAACAKPYQPTVLTQTRLSFQPVPSVVTCCPLGEKADIVDLIKGCKCQDWGTNEAAAPSFAFVQAVAPNGQCKVTSWH